MADTIDAVDPPPPPPPQEVTVVPVDPGPAIPVQDGPPPEEGCFAKKSGLEKCLIILVIIIIVIAIFLVAAFLVYYFFATPPEGTCLTEGCVRSASRLKSHMDDSLDPCNSFYDYSCQGWMKEQVLSPGEKKLDMDTSMKEAHILKLRGILDQVPDTDELEFTRKPKMFYKSCVDVDKLDIRGTEPFFDVVKSIGKFPSLDATWNETDFNYKDTLIKLARMSVMPLFQITVEQDKTNPEQMRIYLTDGKLSLDDRQHYVMKSESKILSDYKQWMADTLVLLGANETIAQDDMDNVINFETTLSETMRDETEKENFKSSYKVFDVDTLQVKYPWIEWLEILQGITSTADGGIGVYIGKDEITVNKEPIYFAKLGKLIEATPKRILANYLMSRLLPLTAHLGSKFIAENEKYSESVYGQEKKPRWEYCAKLVTKVFPESVSRMFVEHYFSKESKRYVTDVANDILSVFEDQLKQNSWMTDTTRNEALAKFEKMDVRVGYPDFIYDDERLIKIYKEISSNEDTYLDNMVSVMRNKATENMKSLRTAPDDSKWTTHPTSLDGQYNLESNKIVLPAAFLQPPIYSPEYSSAMNYAGVASILGREIIHGFDKLGKKYNAKGHAKSWWNKKDEERYDSRTACFLKQWGCYKWDGISMNGEKALDENIAYNAGLKHSYKAYRTFIERRGSEEMRLPGISLDNRQVFFLSYAQMWCAKYGDEAKQDFLSTSVHPPFPYRVFGTLQNSMEFSEAFECPIGTRMNPREKCNLWNN